MEQPGRARRHALVGVDTVKVSLGSKVAGGCHLRRERHILLFFSLARSLDLSPLAVSLSQSLSLSLSLLLPYSLPFFFLSPCAFLYPSRTLGLAFGLNRKVRPSTHSICPSLFSSFILSLSFLSPSLSLSADVCFIFFLYSPFLRSCAPKLGLVRRLLEASRLYFFISRFPCYVRRALRRDARGHTRGISVLHKYVAFSYRGRRKGRDVFAYELN